MYNSYLNQPYKGVMTNVMTLFNLKFEWEKKLVQYVEIDGKS